MSSLIPALHQGLTAISQNPPRIIASPPTQKSRASVALCIRLRLPDDDSSNSTDSEGESGGEALPTTIDEFFAQDWVNQPGVVAEMMFIKRAKRGTDRWGGQLAFPGGRFEPTDESSHYTALRETWEEVGLDLAEGFIPIGQLDDREITSSLGKRLLMVLSPFVFLQVGKRGQEASLEEAEVAGLYWIPLALLQDPPKWSQISISLSPRLSPHNALLRNILHLFVGSMEFSAIPIPDKPEAVAGGVKEKDEFEEVKEEEIRLWGLSLGMTLDFISFLPSPSSLPQQQKQPQLQPPLLIPSSFPLLPPSPNPNAEPVTVVSSFVKTPGTIPGGYPLTSRRVFSASSILDQQPDDAASSDLKHRKASSSSFLPTALSEKGEGQRNKEEKWVYPKRRSVNAGTTSVLPRFTFPDISFFLYIFGRRYRDILSAWEASQSPEEGGSGLSMDRRINWSGATVSAFYSAVRKAVVCAVVLRALTTLATLGFGVWWLVKALTVGRL